ncbi:YcxB family protein [Oleiagrimonas soli]|nr:YcxB family protein [Oleiagrimonas soli]MBB6184864.1 hypothetical protein [Oleiagrimonas soli]
MIHALAAVFLSFMIASDAQGAVSLHAFLNVFAWMLPVVIAIFALVPQALYKPQVRTLDVDAQGWSTRIGRKEGSRPWSQIASVQAWEDNVIIAGRNGNAMIVPARAFDSAAMRKCFLDDATRWHRGTTTPSGSAS